MISVSSTIRITGELEKRKMSTNSLKPPILAYLLEINVVLMTLIAITATDEGMV